MPPTPSAEEVAQHQALLDSLDIQLQARPFRNSNWKPSVRRNKNVKQMIGEASRREASVLATNANNSGATTPMQRSVSGIDGSGVVTPIPAASHGNLSAATQGLDRLVLERNLQAAAVATGGAAAAAGAGAGVGGGSGAASTNGEGIIKALPAVTYTNIESAPSLNPAGKRPYCDVTGLPSKYTDPKTRLRYHDKEVFALVRNLPQGLPERYLEARAAHVVLK